MGAEKQKPRANELQGLLRSMDDESRLLVMDLSQFAFVEGASLEFLHQRTGLALQRVGEIMKVLTDMGWVERGKAVEQREIFSHAGHYFDVFQPDPTGVLYRLVDDVHGVFHKLPLPIGYPLTHK